MEPAQAKTITKIQEATQDTDVSMTQAPSCSSNDTPSSTDITTQSGQSSSSHPGTMPMTDTTPSAQMQQTRQRVMGNEDQAPSQLKINRESQELHAIDQYTGIQKE